MTSKLKTMMWASFALLLTLVVLCDAAHGDYINMSLSANGGVLETGPEAIRDGDWGTFAQVVVGQGGSIESRITFPERWVAYVRYSIRGNSHNYDESPAVADGYVYLRIDGSWTQIDHLHADGGGWYEPGMLEKDNVGLGWDNVSGMKLYSSIWACDTGTAGAVHYEMEAWAVPEPTSVALLGLCGLMVIRRRRKQIARLGCVS